MFPKILEPHFSDSEQDSTASSFSPLIAFKDYDVSYQECPVLGSPSFYRWEIKREKWVWGYLVSQQNYYNENSKKPLPDPPCTEINPWSLGLSH